MRAGVAVVAVFVSYCGGAADAAVDVIVPEYLLEPKAACSAALVAPVAAAAFNSRLRGSGVSTRCPDGASARVASMPVPGGSSGVIAAKQLLGGADSRLAAADAAVVGEAMTVDEAVYRGGAVGTMAGTTSDSRRSPPHELDGADEAADATDGAAGENCDGEGQRKDEALAPLRVDVV